MVNAIKIMKQFLFLVLAICFASPIFATEPSQQNYQNRANIEMPKSKMAAEKTRSRRRSSPQMPWDEVIYGVLESETEESKNEKSDDSDSK